MRVPVQAGCVTFARLQLNILNQLFADMLTANGRVNEEVLQIAVVAFGPRWSGGRDNVRNPLSCLPVLPLRRTSVRWDGKSASGELRDAFRDVDAIKRLVAFPQRQPLGKVAFSRGVEGYLREVNVGFVAIHGCSLFLSTG